MDPEKMGAQFMLFPEIPVEQASADYEPQAWAGRADIVHHASEEPFMPSLSDEIRGLGFHTGTRASAEQRAEKEGRDYIHPVRMTGSMALRPDISGVDAFDPPTRVGTGEPDPRTMVFNDLDANSYTDEIMKNGSDRDTSREPLTIPYINDNEDAGSVSYRSPRKNLKTWSEDVAADPGASRHHQLIAEQYDLRSDAGGKTELRKKS